MQTLKILAQVDELHQLSAAVPDTIRPGEVEILVIVPNDFEDEAGKGWMPGVSREWHDELNDPHQDIYTIADGEPVNVSR